MRSEFLPTGQAGISSEKPTQLIEVTAATPTVPLPVGDALFDAAFSRNGHHLLVELPQEQFYLSNYFAADSFPTLLSETGKKIVGSSVKVLAGADSPLQFAGEVSGGDAIGVVDTLDGEVTVTRNGHDTTLKHGDQVYQDDVIETEGDASVGITFEDGSVFTLGADARMTLDSFVYDPATGDGSSSVNVLKVLKIR